MAVTASLTLIRSTLLAALALASAAAFAQPPAAATASASAAASASSAHAAIHAVTDADDDTAPAVPLKPDPVLEALPRYDGTLGGRTIVLHLGPKTDEPGVHGEYRYVDTGQWILIAGDRDGDTLEVEESNDGTNITGVWMGRFDASGALSADRMNPDESDPQPVVLHPAGAPHAATGAHTAAD